MNKKYDYESMLKWFLNEFFLIDDIEEGQGFEVREKIAVTVDVDKLQKTLIPHHYEEDLINVIERSM
jgi:hypothetical protein